MCGGHFPISFSPEQSCHRMFPVPCKNVVNHTLSATLVPDRILCVWNDKNGWKYGRRSYAFIFYNKVHTAVSVKICSPKPHCITVEASASSYNVLCIVSSIEEDSRGKKVFMNFRAVAKLLKCLRPFFFHFDKYFSIYSRQRLQQEMGYWTKYLALFYVTSSWPCSVHTTH